LLTLAAAVQCRCCRPISHQQSTTLAPALRFGASAGVGNQQSKIRNGGNMEPKYIWMDGSLVEYEKATVHFMTPALH